MPSGKNIIKRIRRIPKPSDYRDNKDDWIVDGRAEIAANEMWERDKEIKREQNFKKAQQALELKRIEAELERQRQEDIHKARLKNLKKARRKLEKIRSST